MHMTSAMSWVEVFPRHLARHQDYVSISIGIHKALLSLKTICWWTSIPSHFETFHARVHVSKMVRHKLSLTLPVGQSYARARMSTKDEQRHTGSAGHRGGRLAGRTLTTSVSRSVSPDSKLLLHLIQRILRFDRFSNNIGALLYALIRCALADRCNRFYLTQIPLTSRCCRSHSVSSPCLVDGSNHLAHINTARRGNSTFMRKGRKHSLDPQAGTKK